MRCRRTPATVTPFAYANRPRIAPLSFVIRAQKNTRDGAKKNHKLGRLTGQRKLYSHPASKR